VRSDLALSRRELMLLGGAAVGALALPEPASAAGALIDPYIGAAPFIFPLADGAFETPLQNNWHGLREGKLYPWNHRGSTALRAHDGVDVYPSANDHLPAVFAPLRGTVIAVCSRSDNTLQAQVTYRASAKTPPPWDYHDAFDDVAQLPLYGNFVWLLSSDPASAGYFVFFCHLQRDATLQALRPDQPVTVDTPLGHMGDTGNAAGYPQLHVEIHYPSGTSYLCGECSPEQRLTSLDPYASLLLAAPRHATATTPSTKPISVGRPASGTLAGQSGGAFAAYALADPGSTGHTVTLSYGPFDAGQAHAIGLNVYQGGVNLASADGQATGLGDRTNSNTVTLAVRTSGTAGELLLQVFNYSSHAVMYTLAIV
jgi:murein DD-endopeptidase MepM/ murein hydrolase activator NlpD